MSSPTRIGWAAIGAASALLLVSCSAGAEPGDSTPSSSASPSTSPSASVSLPAGASLTDPGSDLTFGDTATVAFNPNQNRGTVLELTVDSVRKGSVKDLSGFILDAKAKAAHYYYVKVTVANIGDGDIGRTAVPLWGVDKADTLLPAVDFTTKFPTCDTAPMPATFTAGDRFKTCLVYQVPEGALKAVSFRPTQELAPIEWTGEITKPATKPVKRSAKKKRGQRSD